MLSDVTEAVEQATLALANKVVEATTLGKPHEAAEYANALRDSTMALQTAVETEAIPSDDEEEPTQ